MNLDILLEYQSLDRKLFDKEKEFRECPEVECFLSLQLKLKDLFQTILKLDKETEEILQNFAKKRELAEVAIDQNGRIMQSYESEGNLEKLNAVDDELSRLNRTLQTVDRDISQMQRRLVSILDSYDKYYGSAIAVNKKLKDADVKRSEKRAEMIKGAETIQADLKRAKDSLPAEVLQMYQEVRKRKIMPAVVQFYAVNGSCAGCGMEVRHEVEKTFNEFGVAECPNCGRILYKE